MTRTPYQSPAIRSHGTRCRKVVLPQHGNTTRLAPLNSCMSAPNTRRSVVWQQGDGGLANVALDRALADNRRYSMAELLRRALDSGAPPSMARLPMTPEEVAASYDAQEAGAPGVPAGKAQLM